MFKDTFLSDVSHNYFAVVYWFEDVLQFGLCTHKNPKVKISGVFDGVVNLFKDDYWEDSDWEIVGNIFDDKELLWEVR